MVPHAATLVLTNRRTSSHRLAIGFQLAVADLHSDNYSRCSHAHSPTLSAFQLPVLGFLSLASSTSCPRRLQFPALASSDSWLQIPAIGLLSSAPCSGLSLMCSASRPQLQLPVPVLTSGCCPQLPDLSFPSSASISSFLSSASCSDLSLQSSASCLQLLVSGFLSPASSAQLPVLSFRLQLPVFGFSSSASSFSLLSFAPFLEAADFH